MQDHSLCAHQLHVSSIQAEHIFCLHTDKVVFGM